MHLLQIWILPAARGIEPSYEQRPLPAAARGGLALIGSRDGCDGSVTVHQDAAIYAARLAAGDRAAHVLTPGRHAWVHLAFGRARLDDALLHAGDGAVVSGVERLAIHAEEPAEVLLFDLA